MATIRQACGTRKAQEKKLGRWWKITVQDVQKDMWQAVGRKAGRRLTTKQEGTDKMAQCRQREGSHKAVKQIQG